MSKTRSDRVCRASEPGAIIPSEVEGSGCQLSTLSFQHVLCGAGTLARVITFKDQVPEGWMDFQVNDQTYFLNIGDDGSGWEVMVSTPSGPRHIPVYRDTHDARPVIVLEEESSRLPN